MSCCPLMSGRPAPVRGTRGGAHRENSRGSQAWPGGAKYHLAVVLGSWTVLPDTWRRAYGVFPLDETGVASATAYQAGLQWVVAGAHPPGSQQQGFGSWEGAPERSGL